MARRSIPNRPATMAEIKRHAAGLLYLRTPDKIMAALANEYGSDRKLPSRAFIESIIACPPRRRRAA